MKPYFAPSQEAKSGPDRITTECGSGDVDRIHPVQKDSAAIFLDTPKPCPGSSPPPAEPMWPKAISLRFQDRSA